MPSRLAIQLKEGLLFDAGFKKGLKFPSKTNRFIQYLRRFYDCLYETIYNFAETARSIIPYVTQMNQMGKPHYHKRPQIK